MCQSSIPEAVILSSNILSLGRSTCTREFSVCNLEEQEDPRAFSYTHAVPAEGTIFIYFTKVSAFFIPKYNANGE